MAVFSYGFALGSIYDDAGRRACFDDQSYF